MLITSSWSVNILEPLKAVQQPSVMKRDTELDIQSLLTTLFVSDCDMDTF